MILFEILVKIFCEIKVLFEILVKIFWNKSFIRDFS